MLKVRNKILLNARHSGLIQKKIIENYSEGKQILSQQKL